MTTVISVPPSLDEQTFEHVVEQLAPLPPDQKVLFDARHARWASPYGLTALLCAAQSRTERADFAMPEHPDTVSYWARTGFFRHAADVFELHGTVPRQRESRDSSVLLEITPVTQSDDVHTVVSRIQSKAAEILHGELHLDTSAIMGFGMMLSEACQNIVEHAGRGGWVSVQAYSWRKRLGRRVVVIAVCDAGIGFRQSLESATGHRRDDRWGDARALESAVLQSMSRHRARDAGRGQGLAGIRRFCARWECKLSVRSGAARIALTPPWDEDEAMRDGLPFFPGAQVQIIIPERLPGEPAPAVRARATDRPR